MTNASGSSESTNVTSSGTVFIVVDPNKLPETGGRCPFLDLSNEKEEEILRFPPGRIAEAEGWDGGGGGGVGDGSIPNRPEFRRLLTAPAGFSNLVILLKLSAKEEVLGRPKFRVCGVIEAGLGMDLSAAAAAVALVVVVVVAAAVFPSGVKEDFLSGGGIIDLVGVRIGDSDAIDIGESLNIDAVILFNGVRVALRSLKIPEALIPGAGEPSNRPALPVNAMVVVEVVIPKSSQDIVIELESFSRSSASRLDI